MTSFRNCQFLFLDSGLFHSILSNVQSVEATRFFFFMVSNPNRNKTCLSTVLFDEHFQRYLLRACDHFARICISCRRYEDTLCSWQFRKFLLRQKTGPLRGIEPFTFRMVQQSTRTFTCHGYVCSYFNNHVKRISVKCKS